MDVDGAKNGLSRKYYMETTNINVPRKGMEMTTFLKDGMGQLNFWPAIESLFDNNIFFYSAVDDWDLFEQVLNLIYSSYVRSASEEHPVLMSEAPVSW